MTPNAILLIFLILLGAVVGSFLNVCVYRLAWEKSIIWPSSHCSNCFRPIRAVDNIPIVSWLVLRGRCRRCGQKFSPRYMLIEAATAALFGLSFVIFSPTNLVEFVRFLFYMFLVGSLIVATFIDFDMQIIPDSVTVPGMIVGLLGATFVPNLCLVPVTEPCPDPSRVGIVVLALLLICGWILWFLAVFWVRQLPPESKGTAEIILLAVSALYLLSQAIAPLLRRGPWSHDWPESAEWLSQHPHWQGLTTAVLGLLTGAGLIELVRILGTAALRREAMGFGDVTLMAMVGAFLGWQAALVVFFMAPFLGLAVGLVQLAIKGDNVLPYGPYLSTAAVITLLGWPIVWDFMSPRLDLLYQIGLSIPGIAMLLFFPVVLMSVLRNWKVGATT